MQFLLYVHYGRSTTVSSMTRKGLPGLDLNGIEKVERGAEDVAAIDDFFVFCSLKIFFRRQNSAGKTAKKAKNAH